MAVTEFGTNSVQTVKLWSKLLMREAIFKTFFNRFLGTGANAIIQRVSDLESKAGDTVYYDLLVQMTGYGVDGDTKLEGKEEELVYYQDTVKIDQKRLGHAFRRMSQQRTLHQLRTDARANLSDRWAVIYDQFMWAYLTGKAFGDLATALPFAANSLQAPDAPHLHDKTGSTMTVAFIDALVEKARTLTPPLRPALVNGEEKFVLVLHPYQVTAMRTATGEGKWLDITKSAGPRGAGNNIWSGALGEYNGVILHMSSYIPFDSVAGEAYAPFLGAQAGVLAFGNAYSRFDQQTFGRGNMFSWFERTDDYGNEKGVAAGSIYGIKKTRFNSADFGVIRLDTDAAAAT